MFLISFLLRLSPFSISSSSLLLSFFPTFVSHQTHSFPFSLATLHLPQARSAFCSARYSPLSPWAAHRVWLWFPQITFLDDRMGWDVQMFTRSLLRMYLCFSCLVPALDVLIMKHHTLNSTSLAYIVIPPLPLTRTHMHTCRSPPLQIACRRPSLGRLEMLAAGPLLCLAQPLDLDLACLGVGHLVHRVPRALEEAVQCL